MKLKYVLVFLTAVVFLILTVASPAMAGAGYRSDLIETLTSRALGKAFRRAVGFAEKQGKAR